MDSHYSIEKWAVEKNIDQLKKAIKNIGNADMQEIIISTSDSDISFAKENNDYINLSHYAFAHKAIKRILINMLHNQQKILKYIKE
jgi:hypothetical protein